MPVLMEVSVVCRVCGEEAVVWERGDDDVDVRWSDYCSSECQREFESGREDS
jgi:hypothetical protein